MIYYNSEFISINFLATTVLDTELFRYSHKLRREIKM